MRLLLSLALAGLAGCTVAPAADTPAPAASFTPASHSAFGQEFTAAEAAACTASGGAVSRRGRLGTDYCVTPLPDAGKVCSDKADCTGQCLTSAVVPGGTMTKGTCQPNNGPLFGCYNTVVGGKATPGICVD